MNGMLSGIRDYVARFNAAKYQGMVVFRLTPEQYDKLAEDLHEVGDHKDFRSRPALMVAGAKVEVK